MPDAKIYLDVPYAQKDAAKALGARWDAANKKWYAPPGKDVSLFAKWQAQSGASMPRAAATGASKTPAATVDKASTGRTTRPADKDFVAYDGDEPPWD